MRLGSRKGPFVAVDDGRLQVSGKIVGDVLAVGPRRYMFLKPDDPTAFDAVDALGGALGAANRCVNDSGNILVKLPFRYGRYGIHWVELSSSQDIQHGNRCTLSVDVCGFNLQDASWTPSLKCVRFDAR